MSDENGSSNGGGNTSVYWDVRDGGPGNPRPPKNHTGQPPAPRGHVKVDGVDEGHTDHNFDEIGKPDHPGLFKVVLRFRIADWDKVPANERAWLERPGVTQVDGANRFLTVHVPAIKREQPGPNGKWDDMPWEIHWEW